jgi:hypothetical protein
MGQGNQQFYTQRIKMQQDYAGQMSLIHHPTEFNSWIHQAAYILLN